MNYFARNNKCSFIGVYFVLKHLILSFCLVVSFTNFVYSSSVITDEEWQELKGSTVRGCVNLGVCLISDYLNPMNFSSPVVDNIYYLGNRSTAIYSMARVYDNFSTAASIILSVSCRYWGGKTSIPEEESLQRKKSGKSKQLQTNKARTPDEIYKTVKSSLAYCCYFTNITVTGYLGLQMLEDAYQKGDSFSGVVAPFMISASFYSVYELLKQYKTKNVEERDRNIFRIINALTMSWGIQTLNEICFIKEESGRISVGNGYEMIEYTCVYPWWYNLMETTGTYAMRALFFDGALNIGEAIQSKIRVTWDNYKLQQEFLESSVFIEPVDDSVVSETPTKRKKSPVYKKLIVPEDSQNNEKKVIIQKNSAKNSTDKQLKKKEKTNTSGKEDITKINPRKRMNFIQTSNSDKLLTFQVNDYNDEYRENQIKEIEDFRRLNSATKQEIKRLLSEAAQFVDGELITLKKNKRGIKWSTGDITFLTLYENNHKQSGEKSSKWKGYKLNRVLDACVRCYLQGWRKENIQNYFDHYDKRKFYNLPGNLLNTLWERPGY